MNRLILWLPLAVFAAFLAVVAFRLGGEQDSSIRSRMVGKPMPEFALEAALPGRAPLSSADLKSGRPRMVNVFGSWCIPCQVESPQLLALKARGVPIDAIAIRDTPEDVARFLVRHGDPFERIGDDPRSQVQFALGSAGVPETFVVDGQGIIRHQHIGEVRPEHVPELLAAWQAAK
ncbi:MAG TPA: DsbE family thiol:disulfide interchange protein [Allosphingosinicella sp.]|nr:DsbE family thiol:disulfide interchange protein [Allosphingosinicella sp.]